MIEPSVFYEAMRARGVNFFTGVPDSLLANFCAYVDDQGGREQHLITANEGNAVALAIGFHLATGNVAAVYMQNSGLGNAVNPLTSLADPEVYKVPMMLVIGWRGEPGSKDEPQHIKQGRITQEQLDALEIPFWIVDSSSDVDSVLDSAFAAMVRRNAPAALLVRKGTFSEYKQRRSFPDMATMARETALEQILELCDANDLVVCTTGKASREVFDLRVQNGQPQRELLVVGGMGHASSIALGVAVGQPNRRVVCLDGDGSMLMHMGALPIIAGFKPAKFVHILLNNCAHESVGGQATAAGHVDFEQLARACGYTGYAMAGTVESLKTAWQHVAALDGPVLLEVKVRNGSRINLGRPTSTAEQNKLAFMAAAQV